MKIFEFIDNSNANRETTGKSLFNPHPNSHNGYPMDIQHTGTTPICRMMFWITWYVKANYSCCRSLGVTNLIHEGSLAEHVFAFHFPNLASFTSLSLSPFPSPIPTSHPSHSPQDTRVTESIHELNFTQHLFALLSHPPLSLLPSTSFPLLPFPSPVPTSHITTHRRTPGWQSRFMSWISLSALLSHPPLSLLSLSPLSTSSHPSLPPLILSPLSLTAGC